MKSPTQNRSNGGHNLAEILILTFLGVIMYVSQVIMAPLPNIEIVSLLIILTAKRFGVKSLCSVYLFALCEIFTYGLGIWSVNYLYVWTVLCLAVIFLRKNESAFVFSLLSAVFGLLFGTLCSVPYFIIGGIPGGIANIIAGIGFDLIHCAGNFVICITLYKPLYKVLLKIK